MALARTLWYERVTHPAPEPAVPTKTILLVEDNDEIRPTIKLFLVSFGYVIESVRNAEEALAVFDSQLHDLVITDNSMSGLSGTEMAHVIKLRSPSTPVLMYTGLPPEDQPCVDRIVQKPKPLQELKDAIATLLAT